jgi:hypothetical protein
MLEKKKERKGKRRRGKVEEDGRKMEGRRKKKEDGRKMEGRWKEDGRKMEGRIPPLIVVSCSLLFAFFVAFVAFVLPLPFLSCLLFICQAPPPPLPPLPPLPAAAHRPTKAKTAETPEETNVPKKTRNWTPSVKRHVCGITLWNILISNFPRTSPPSNFSSLELPSNFSSLELLLLPQNTKKPSRATKYW